MKTCVFEHDIELLIHQRLRSIKCHPYVVWLVWLYGYNGINAYTVTLNVHNEGDILYNYLQFVFPKHLEERQRHRLCNLSSLHLGKKSLLRVLSYWNICFCSYHAFIINRHKNPHTNERWWHFQLCTCLNNTIFSLFTHLTRAYYFEWFLSYCPYK